MDWAAPLAVPGGMPVADFLRDYWQKQPLLIRGAFPGFVSPLTPEELAGLACEDDVESRLVLAEGGREPWELRDGPFRAEDFQALPARHWSLLVQAVDHWVPAVAELLEAFRFIPDWRVDDVMVSHAVEGGNVGPHYDHYDVFLLQGLGRRRWLVGPRCDSHTRLRPHGRLRLLQDLAAIEDWVLEAGDMLYLPPGWAHQGIALESCLTFSIGFRAPSLAEAVSGYAMAVAETLDDDRRYTDPDLQPQANPGEIPAAAVETLRRLILAQLDDPVRLGGWFGRAMTEPRDEGVAQPPARPFHRERLQRRLRGTARLCRNEGSRFAFLAAGPATVLLFVDGEAIPCTGATAELARLLCARRRIEAVALAPFLGPPAGHLLVRLLNQGSLYLA